MNYMTYPGYNPGYSAGVTGQVAAQYQPQVTGFPYMNESSRYAPQQQINSGLNWVQGEAGAKSYLVAPNSTVLLMDSDSSRFYLKSADSAGMPSLRVFEYKELSQNQPVAPAAVDNMDMRYVTRDEFQQLLDSLSQHEPVKKTAARKAPAKEDSASE